MTEERMPDPGEIAPPRFERLTPWFPFAVLDPEGYMVIFTEATEDAPTTEEPVGPG